MYAYVRKINVYCWITSAVVVATVATTANRPREYWLIAISQLERFGLNIFFRRANRQFVCIRLVSCCFPFISTLLLGLFFLNLFFIETIEKGPIVKRIFAKRKYFFLYTSDIQIVFVCVSAFQEKPTKCNLIIKKKKVKLIYMKVKDIFFPIWSTLFFGVPVKLFGNDFFYSDYIIYAYNH